MPEEVNSGDKKYSKLEQAVAVHLYKIYQEQLKEANGVDFGDLTLYNNKIFKEKAPFLLQRYQKAFEYILVDEF